MCSKLKNKELSDAVEHYAYRTSDKCVKNEQIKLMVGGLYDWHPATTFKVAKKIFDDFNNSSKQLEENKNKCETFHAVNKEEENYKKYRIHIFATVRTASRRRSVWIYSGILLSLPNKLGYCRVFRMPCKFDTDKFRYHNLQKFVTD